MLKMAMSPAALGLLRALIARAGVPRDRIFLASGAPSIGNRSRSSASVITSACASPGRMRTPPRHG